jgi:hypothetical protein
MFSASSLNCVPATVLSYVLCSAGVAVELSGLGGDQRLRLLVGEGMVQERVEQQRALLRRLVLGQGHRVERLDVTDQGGVGLALPDLLVQGDHVGNRAGIGADHRQRGLAGLGLGAQARQVLDIGEHGGHPGLDVGRVGTADPGGQRLDPGRRDAGGAVRAVQAAGLGQGRDPGRLVALILQRLHQPGDLLSENGELRHAAELVRAVDRRPDLQAAEDQPHEQGQDDHGDQPGGHRPVLQGQPARTGEVGGLGLGGVLVGAVGARSGARHPMVSHRRCPRWLRALSSRGTVDPPGPTTSGCTNLGCRNFKCETPQL